MKKKAIIMAAIAAVLLIGGCRAFEAGVAEDIVLETQTMCEVLGEASRFSEVDYGEERAETVYEGWCDERLAGYVFLISEEGYRSNITMAVGIDVDTNVTGVKILQQKETSGRGSLITETAFLAQFCKEGRTADETVEAVSGATVSSQAVARGVQKAIAMAKELM